jgi:benzoate membrane transport protein
VVAGFVTVLVGFTGTAVLVLQAAETVGADAAHRASWMWALGLGLGLVSIVPSLRYRVPVASGWSTPGAALLITGGAGVSLPEATGAFMACALLIAISGYSGLFARAMNQVPQALAAGMLAGVLLRFGLDVFVAMKTQLPMTLSMLLAFLLARRWSPRYAVLVALVVGCLIAAQAGLLGLGEVRLELARPLLVVPRFSSSALVGVALPLFVVTMASQNVPGVAVIRASGFQIPISSVIGWSGVVTLALAPFGAFAVSLAAITAAICLGPEAHEDPKRRYVAAVVAAVLYIMVGLFGGTVAGLFAAFPKELVMTLAGLALFGTTANGLAQAMADEKEREPAMLAFLVTASGVPLLGIGSAFWGLVAGVIARMVLVRSAKAG